MKTYKVVRRESPPIEADEAHRVLPPQPAGGPKPAIYAYVLLALWRRARMSGDLPTARALLAELERLAQRPPRSAARAGGGGGRDDTDE